MADETNKEKDERGEELLQEPVAGELEQKLAECEKKRDEYLTGWQRAKADFINYKREELARLEEIARYASEDLIRDFITVLDSFDIGIAALEKSGEVEKGIYMIRTQIEDALRKWGLERIPVKAGDAFDPRVAESIKAVESDEPPGTVLEEVEPGYRLHDKVIRPARVKITKKKGENE